MIAIFSKRKYVKCQGCHKNIRDTKLAILTLEIGEVELGELILCRNCVKVIGNMATIINERKDK